MVVLNIPGITNSGSEHWQTFWEQQHGFKRVQQKDWDAPNLTDWCEALAAEISLHESVVLVAHSLGCLLVVHWANLAEPHVLAKVKAALLVAVPDPDGINFPTAAPSFKNPPSSPLPFTSLVLASNNDEYATVEFQKDFAKKLQCECTELGPLGHINSKSNLGNWPKGFGLLQEFLNKTR